MLAASCSLDQRCSAAVANAGHATQQRCAGQCQGLPVTSSAAHRRRRGGGRRWAGRGSGRAGRTWRQGWRARPGLVARRRRRQGELGRRRRRRRCTHARQQQRQQQRSRFYHAVRLLLKAWVAAVPRERRVRAEWGAVRARPAALTPPVFQCKPDAGCQLARDRAFRHAPAPMPEMQATKRPFPPAELPALQLGLTSHPATQIPCSTAASLRSARGHPRLAALAVQSHGQSDFDEWETGRRRPKAAPGEQAARCSNRRPRLLRQAPLGSDLLTPPPPLRCCCR